MEKTIWLDACAHRLLQLDDEISIDAADFAERASGPGATRCLNSLRQQFEGRQVLVGVDRLDYTKGILERMRALELLLELRRPLRGTLAFLQIAVPSRGEIREYRQLRASVEQAVGRINGRFTEPGQDVPVHYLHRGITPDRLLAYYRLADACLVTPLSDGMNLVAKEFVTAQAATGGTGALVLSEFTGAAEEFRRDALLCNPFDVDGLAATIESALELKDDDRRARVQRMATHARLPLVAYANRLPVQKIRDGWQASAGGLVAALRPALETRESAWVGWDGGAEDMPRRVTVWPLTSSMNGCGAIRNGGRGASEGSGRSCHRSS
jgi:trehalose-6-phosphate synthase